MIAALAPLTMLGNSDVAAASDSSFSVAIGFLGLALPCFALAWDGLIRRRLLLPAFPVGAALGAQAFVIRRLASLAIGLLCLLADGFLLLLVWGTWIVAADRRCQQGQGAFTCLGTLAGSAQVYAWVWLGMWVLWFMVVWLRMGDPRKRVLVYGAWYHQEQVARVINQQLQEQGRSPLPQERLYALEQEVLDLMRVHGWLVYGDAWLDGSRKQPPVEITPERMLDEVLRAPAFQGVGETERLAISLLLVYFHALAERTQSMSRLRRWWVGTGQRGKLGVYGRRAL